MSGPNFDIDNNIFEIARSYPEDARYTPPEEREQHFSAAQKLGWICRFGTDEEFRQAIVDLNL